MGVPHIVFGDERGHVQMQGWIGLFLHHRALQPLDGLLHHLEIQIQADRGDVARLLLAQEVACAANFQVGGRDPEAGPQFRELLDRHQSLLGVAAQRAVVWKRLWTKKVCPPRPISRTIASRTALSLKWSTWVRMARRPAGGVSITDRSRTPDIAIWRVRGMGVAVSVRTSTCVRSCLRRSLWRTPNHCSSSMMTNPKFLNCTSFCSRRCVPITTSSVPAARSRSVALISPGV